MFFLNKKPVYLVFVILLGFYSNCFCVGSKSKSASDKSASNKSAQSVNKSSINNKSVGAGSNLVDAKYQKIVDEYKKIKIEDINLENKNIKNSDFLFGVATSSYQVEGHDGALLRKGMTGQTVGCECKKCDCCASCEKISCDKNKESASASEYDYCHWLNYLGKKVTIEVGDKKEEKIISDPGTACEHWKRYKADIKLVKDLGCNAYRFSIAWGKVEPKEGVFSQEALKHYEDVCKELKKHGIRPIITLYHYAHPMWFENKGAFEKTENIKYFVDYCMKMFEKLNKYDPIWFPINTFTGASLHAYYMGTKPPFKKDMGLGLKVLKNLLEAHVQFYRKAKKFKKEPKSTIGIYKIIFPIDKYRSWQVWDGVGVSFVEKLNNNAIYDFFTKGELNIDVGIPALFVKNSIHYKNAEAKGAADCIGLNYYSGAYMSNFKVVPRVECIPTQSSLSTVYPEGFYAALKQVDTKLAKKLNIPIYVTENGIATDNCAYRDAFYKSHLNVLSQAMREGIDVRGYMVWSLFDCFDWLEGYNFEYGIYAVDRNTQERTRKPGTEFFTDVIKAHNVAQKSKVTEKNILEDKQTALVKKQEVFAGKYVIEKEMLGNKQTALGKKQEVSGSSKELESLYLSQNLKTQNLTSSPICCLS